MRSIVWERLQESFKSPEEALHAAVRDNDLGSLQSHLASDTVDLGAPSRGFVTWGTALHVAVQCNNITAAHMLLEAGAEPLQVWEDGIDSYTPLSLAARLGHAELLRLIWPHILPRMRVEALKACFLEAATFGHSWITEYVLDCWTAEVETEELVSEGRKIKEAALYRAAAKWQANVVDLLLDRVQYRQEILLDTLGRACGYKVMLSMDEGAPVHYEGFDYTNQQRIIRRLLKIGVDPNSLRDGEPLIYQALDGPRADPNVRFSPKKNGRAPLHYLAVPCLVRDSSPETSLHETGVRLLLEHGASVTLTDDSGETPLHAAAYGCNLGLFRFLLSKAPSGVALLETNSHGESLLHYAAASKNVEVIQFLLSSGRFNVNQPNANGWTPIMCALTATLESYVGRPKPLPPSLVRRATQILLDHGANSDVAAAEGWTPPHCLARNQSAEDDADARTLAELLISRGAPLEAEAPGLARQPRRGARNNTLPKPWGFRVRELMEQFPEVLLPPSTPLIWAVENRARAVETVLLSLAGPASYNRVVTQSSAKEPRQNIPYDIRRQKKGR